MNYKVKILHGINNHNFVPLEQRFNLFISPAIYIYPEPAELYTFIGGQYKTIMLNNLPVINVAYGDIISNDYPHLDKVCIKFEDRQCHSKTHQYYVSFEKS